MKIDKLNITHWTLLIRSALVSLFSSTLRPATRNIVLLYGHKLNGNLLALYEHLIKSSDLEVFFTSMDKKYIRELNSINIRTLDCTRMSSAITIAAAKIVITDHGLHSLVLLKIFSNIKFIDVWHGIPFKGFDKNDFSLQLTYDEIWVASEFHKRLYTEKYKFDPNKVFVTGYARTDVLIKEDHKIHELKIKYKIPPKKKIIAFCPTWKQDDKNRNIFPFNTEETDFLSKIEDFCYENNVLFMIRTHLNTKSNNPIHYENIYFIDADNYPITEEILLISDILICDWSSICFDYLLLKRPTIFLDVPIPFKKGLSIPATFRYGDIADSVDATFDFLEEYIYNTNKFYDRNGKKIEEVTEIIYGEFCDGKSSERCANRLLKLLN